MKNRTLALMMAMALAVSLLAACGGSPSTPAATTTAAATTAAATTTAATTAAATTAATTTTAAPTEAAVERVKIKVASTRPQDDDPESSWEDFNYWTPIVEARFPNIEFEWDRWAPGEDYRQQYDMQLMAGAAPNVGMHFPYVDIRTRLANNTIGEMTSYVNSWDLKKQDLVSTVFDEAIQTRDGKWYAIPGAPYVNGVVINMETIREAGGDPSITPATWSEFAQVASDLTDKDEPRFGFLLLGSEWNAWPFIPWVWASGGEMVRENPDGTWTPAFAEDAGVDAAMFMNSLIWEHNATQRDILEDYNTFNNRFIAGEGIFGWGSPPGYSADNLARFDRKQEDISFMPIPAKDDGGRQVTFAGGEVWTFNPNNTQAENDAAWEFITFYSYDKDFLLSYWEKQNSLNRLSANPSVRNDLVETKYNMATSWPGHWAKLMADGFAMARPEPFCPNWNDLKNEIVIPLQTIYLNENITWDEAKALFEACAKTLVEKYPESFQIP